MSYYGQYHFHKKGGKGIYKRCQKYLPEVFDTVYVNESELPIKQRYAEAYAEKLSELDKKILNGKKYNPEKFRTTVSRTIDAFVKDGIMKDVGEMGKYFVPNNEKYQRYLKRRDIINNVEFARSDILVINEKMIAVTIRNGDSQIVQDSFKDFLGDDCYSVILLEDTLLILLCQNEKDTTEQLQKLIEEAYTEQHNVKKK